LIVDSMVFEGRALGQKLSMMSDIAFRTYKPTTTTKSPAHSICLYISSTLYNIALNSVACPLSNPKCSTTIPK
jgi:hypothetical protein